MAKTKVPFTGTKPQQDQLNEAIKKYQGTKGALIPVLHEAQEIYGYLPIEVQTMIAEGLDIPLSEIYGVVTFYTQFSLTPNGKYNIAVCLGTACYVKGSGKIIDAFKSKLKIDVGDITPDGNFSIEATRCIGACGLAPVLTVNDDVYGRIDENQIDKEVTAILAKY